MTASVITPTKKRVSKRLWLLSYRESTDEYDKIVFRVFQSKKDGYSAFIAIVQRLEALYPEELWFAEIENAPGRTKFRTESYSTDKIFAGLELVPFEPAFSRLTKATKTKQRR